MTSWWSSLPTATSTTPLLLTSSTHNPSIIWKIRCSSLPRYKWAGKRREAMDGAILGAFDELHNIMLGDTATCMSQRVIVFHLLVNIVRIFCYSRHDKRLLWKGRKQGRLERAVERAKCNFLPLCQTPLRVCIIVASIVSCSSSREHGLPGQLISLEVN